MNYLVIGCGITGAVIARELAENDNTVVICERRNHIAGNMYDYKDEHGILVQEYGPHIFHTSNSEVIDYVKKYEDWNDYKLVCGATWDGKFTNTPFNFSTIDAFFDREKASEIKMHLKDAYPNDEMTTVVELLNHDDFVIREFAKFLFDNDYAPYTAKQWGMNPADVDPSVLKRVPIRLSYEKGYFSDVFEAMPVHSFTRFIENILDHYNIQVKLNVDAKEHINIHTNKVLWDGNVFDGRVVYTGPLDELFDCCFGKLPYRSLSFEWKYLNCDSYQEAAVVAYPKEKGYTRITEYKKLPQQDVEGTVIAIEYPRLYKDNQNMEPYYPVSTTESEKIYEKYVRLAKQIENLSFCGRLANFKYYNMDQAIYNALLYSKELLKE